MNPLTNSNGSNSNGYSNHFQMTDRPLQMESKMRGKNKKWTEQMVKDEIVAWHKEGKPLYSHYMRQHYQELLAAGIRYFGTWKEAVEHSGVDYTAVRRYQNWSQEAIIAKIRELHAQAVDLSFRSMMLTPHNAMVYAAIRKKHFGSWKNALQAAGLTASEIYRYRSWDEDTILNEIRELHQKGADLSSKAMDEAQNPLIATARRRFGNWENAVRQAGIDYSAIRRRRRWTHQMILDGIRQLKQEGVSLQSAEARKANPALFAAACKPHFFGSWTRAIEEAGDTTAVAA